MQEKKIKTGNKKKHKEADKEGHPVNTFLDGEEPDDQSDYEDNDIVFLDIEAHEIVDLNEPVLEAEVASPSEAMERLARNEPLEKEGSNAPFNDKMQKTLLSALEDQRQAIDELKAEFQSKLKYDAHKEKIIDKLHGELQVYKNDMIKKHSLSVFMDLIKIIDDIRKWMQHYRAKDAATRDPAKIVEFIEAIPSDIEDIFYWQGVKPFRCGAIEFNPSRQRAIKRIATDNPSKNRTVAESLRVGYEWGDKIIRPEMVTVYQFKGETV